MALLDALLFRHEGRAFGRARAHFGRFRDRMRLVKLTLRSYLLELRYFLTARGIPFRGAAETRALIRKRTHHLERSLFHPARYAPSFASDAVRDIEALLATPGTELPRDLNHWVRKILKEHRDMSGPCGCDTLNRGVQSKRPLVDAESLLKLIRQRRSRRVWLPEPLTEAQRSALVDAALWTPSACNRQTLSFVFVEEPELKAFVAGTVMGGHQFFADAPAILVIVSDARDYSWPHDRHAPFGETGAAIQNIYLMCETMGLGCCWANYNSTGTIRSEAEVRRRLGIPDTHLITGALALGRSTEFVCPIPRDPPATRYGIDRMP